MIRDRYAAHPDQVLLDPRAPGRDAPRQRPNGDTGRSPDDEYRQGPGHEASDRGGDIDVPSRRVVEVINWIVAHAQQNQCGTRHHGNSRPGRDEHANGASAHLPGLLTRLTPPGPSFGFAVGLGSPRLRTRVSSSTTMYAIRTLAPRRPPKVRTPCDCARRFRHEPTLNTPSAPLSNLRPDPPSTAQMVSRSHTPFNIRLSLIGSKPINDHRLRLVINSSFETSDERRQVVSPSGPLGGPQEPGLMSGDVAHRGPG